MALLLFLLLAVSVQGFSQTNTFHFELFPKWESFNPLKGNYQEARLGVLYYPNNGNLKVDIGNSINIIGASDEKSGNYFTVGIDFMAYAKVTSFKGYRLQIDAVDGFFGGNLSYVKTLDNDNRFLSRFRFIHNSAHLVDGSYDLDENRWIERLPIPYTRDFAEVTAAHELNFNSLSLKYFGGVSYSVMVRPKGLLRDSYHAGFEAAFPSALGKFLNKNISLYTSYFFRLSGVDKHIGSNHISAGIKFGEWNREGVVFYLSYYSGQDFFNAYFDKKISKFGIGFQVDW